MIRLPRPVLRHSAIAMIAGVLALAAPPTVKPASAGSGAFWAVFGGLTALSLAAIASHPRYVYAAPVYAYPPAYYYPPAPAYSFVPPPAVSPMMTPMAAQPTSGDFRSADGRLCRNYQATVSTAVGPQVVHGTACQGPDGIWRVAN